MAFYEEMQDIATGLLTEFKQGVIQYVSITPGNGPAHNPGPSMRGDPVTLKAAVARGVSAKYVLRGLAVGGDTQVTMDAKQVTPAVGGKMVVDGRELDIVQVIRKPDAGTVVAFVCICRRGG